MDEKLYQVNSTKYFKLQKNEKNKKKNIMVGKII
jgi:hypothetical protein